MTERDEQMELVDRAKRGDRSAFAVLVRRTATRVLHVLRAMGLRTEDAEDVMQETFIRAWDNLARFDTRYRFTTWLYTIARRLAVSHHRAQKPTMPLTIDPASSSEPAIDRDDDGSLWRHAATVLNTQQYQVLWMRYAEDMKPGEIARATGLSESNVRVSLHRARHALAELAARQAASDSTVGR